MKSMIFKTLSTVVDDLFAYVPNAQDPILDTDARVCQDFALRCRSCIGWHVSETMWYS